MENSKLVAIPMREGVTISDERKIYDWREYLWNNGRVSRIYLSKQIPIDSQNLNLQDREE